ncbi:MAG: dTDP-4-dehydrorhamnose reductase [Phycisphaerales bacterium]|nr:MAG: dTDP-4-dehydrorhamnose reductase [Phycisphaerales bacterium]
MSADTAAIGRATDAMRAHGVLLLGAQGMLGRAWRELLASHDVPCLAPLPGEVDLADPDLAEKLPGAGWGTLINCAAWTDVDGAEAHEVEATVVNGAAPGHLARACRERSATLVHYSTDYVFAGDGSEAYRVDEARRPLNAYGRSKAAGEAAIEAAFAGAGDGEGGWLTVRTSWLYAPWGHNFVRTIAKLCASRPEISVVDDQRGRPTSAEGLARTTVALLGAGVRGFAHGTDGGACTWFEFATAIERLTRGEGGSARAACVVKPCGSEAFPRPAKRPAYSVLDLSETERAIGPMQSWRDALAGVVARMG